MTHEDGHYYRLEGRYVSMRYVNAQNTKSYPAYLVFDATFNIQLSETWYLIVAIKNLLNDRYIDIREYPIPGTDFFIGSGIAFK